MLANQLNGANRSPLDLLDSMRTIDACSRSNMRLALLQSLNPTLLSPMNVFTKVVIGLHRNPRYESRRVSSAVCCLAMSVPLPHFSKDFFDGGNVTSLVDLAVLTFYLAC